MLIDQTVVEKISELARLELSPQEKSKFEKDLTAILSHFDRLSNLQTEWIEEISQVTWLSNIEREDIISSSLINENLISCAPNKSWNWAILVKNVL